MIITKIGAKKIEGTDNWRQIFDDHNDSVDAHDKISDAMTYVVSGNKSVETASIPIGSYVRLVKSSIAGRADGIYTAKKAIPVAPDTIDDTYLNETAPISGGIGNALNGNLNTLLNWTLAGSTTEKNTDITVPGTANDRLFIIRHKNGYEFSTMVKCDTTAHYYYLGSYVTVSSVLFAEIACSVSGGQFISKVSIIKFDGSDVANGDFTFSVYYR